MTYERVTTENRDQIRRNGEVIYQISDGESIPNPSYILAILEDANFDQQQKDALLALITEPTRIDNTQ